MSNEVNNFIFIILFLSVICILFYILSTNYKVDIKDNHKLDLLEKDNNLNEKVLD
jgi:hypothetical protein